MLDFMKPWTDVPEITDFDRPSSQNHFEFRFKRLQHPSVVGKIEVHRVATLYLNSLTIHIEYDSLHLRLKCHKKIGYSFKFGLCAELVGRH